MADQVINRVNACQSILDALRGRTSFQKVSVAERTRLQAVMLSANMSSLDLGQVAAAVKKVGFDDADESILMDLIGDLAGRGSCTVSAVAGNARCTLQNYEDVLHHLTATIWAQMTGGDVYAFIDFALRLGLRSPTEGTFRALALAHLFQTEGLDKVLAMQPEAKTALVKSMKSIFRTRAKLVQPPLEWIVVFPRNVEQLRREHGPLWEANFASEHPVVCPISEIGMEQMKQGTRMRMIKRASVMDMGSLQNGLGMPSQLVAFGQGHMNQMSIMANEISQLKGSSPGHAQLTSLNMQTAGFPPTPLVSTSACRSVAPALALRDLPAPQAKDPVGAPAEASSTAIAEQAPAHRSVSEATAEILGLMNLKRKAGEDKKGAAKAKGKKDSDKAEDESTAPKAKAKAKLQAEAKAQPDMKAGKKGKMGISHEKSRSQYLGRLPGQPSKVFKYDGSQASKRKAEASAKAWCRSWCKEQRLPIPPKFQD